jgi:hypothetical protein
MGQWEHVRNGTSSVFWRCFPVSTVAFAPRTGELIYHGKVAGVTIGWGQKMRWRMARQWVAYNAGDQNMPYDCGARQSTGYSAIRRSISADDRLVFPRYFNYNGLPPDRFKRLDV